MKNIVGVDPGMNGSLTLITGLKTISLKMGDTEEAIFKNLCYLLNYSEHGSELADRDLCLVPLNTIVYLEKVHTMPTTGLGSMRCTCGRYHKTVKVIQGGASQGKFMQGYGFLRGLLIALKVPFEDVQPRAWQKVFVEPKKKTETKTEHKNKLKAKAQSLFPDIKVTLALADSLLIAEFGRRVINA